MKIKPKPRTVRRVIVLCGHGGRHPRRIRATIPLAGPLLLPATICYDRCVYSWAPVQGQWPTYWETEVVDVQRG